MSTSANEITHTPPSQLTPSSEEAKSINLVYGDDKKKRVEVGDEADYPIETIASLSKLKSAFHPVSLCLACVCLHIC
jgi:hypothetical protein